MHSNDQVEHDARLELVIKRGGKRGLNLNAARCQFSMDKLTIVGKVMSANGISCAADKAKSITTAKEDPQNLPATHIFLGLVNYCGPFIPDLSTISEPLRRLTKRQKHHSCLEKGRKKRLSSPVTN